MVAADLADLVRLYQDLHAHPELAFQEVRTAAAVASALTARGFEVTSGVGGTGVVGVLRNGPGPVVLVRAELDALPVRELTGLPYASTATGPGENGERVPVMHACGHDLHVCALLGACGELAGSRSSWSGTVVAVGQPAEETGRGALALVDDGLFRRFPRPDVLLAQHVTAMAPAGVVSHCPGTVLAAADTLLIRLVGRGGHGGRPERTVDPVVMAASLVLRLQTIVSRELSPQVAAAVTVGSLHAGSASGVIPEHAELRVGVRTFDGPTRTRVLDALVRMARAEAVAAGAPVEPEVVPPATSRVYLAHREEFGRDRVLRVGPATASEDFGVLGEAAGVPSVYWFLGSVESGAFAAAAAAGTLEADIPANHSAHYAPAVEPVLRSGVLAMTSAVRTWLGS